MSKREFITMLVNDHGVGVSEAFDFAEELETMSQRDAVTRLVDEWNLDIDEAFDIVEELGRSDR